MNDKRRNILEALERIMYFGEANPQLANDLPLTAEFFAANQENINRLNQAGITSVSASSAGRSETRSKVARAREIKSDLRRIAATARILERKLFGFQNKFILPRGNLNYQEMFEIAESFLIDSAPNRGDFVKYGLNEQFFTGLNADLNAFREASHEQADARRTAVGATADTEAILETALDVREDLDVVLRNYYRNDPEKLAEWLTAHHIERRRRRNEMPPGAPPVIVSGMQ